MRREHRHRIATEIRTSHRHNMRLPAFDKLPQMRTEFVVGVGGYMVEFVHSNQAAVKCFHAKLIHCKTESGVRANQNPIFAV